MFFALLRASGSENISYKARFCRAAEKKASFWSEDMQQEQAQAAGMQDRVLGTRGQQWKEKQ